MKLFPPFYLRENHTDSILDLLQKTTLGTNGAKYQHLNTKEIIKDLDNPLFLSLERNDIAIGNITFCRRNDNWYIRYFAFDSLFQSKESSNKRKKSTLKDNISSFFEDKLNEGISFYAYIDPKNIRSKQMSKTFGFQKIGSLITYSFSRKNPKINKNLIELSENKSTYLDSFNAQLFHTPYQANRTKIYVLYSDSGEEIASARVQHALWRIERLPGKLGGLLVKLIPYIPLINQFFKPSNYQFLVPDCVKANSSDALETLFESILAQENSKLMLWWLDEKDLLNRFENKISWGIFKYFLGNPKVDVVAKLSKEKQMDTSKPFFVNGIDLI